ncbi:MAG: UDP-glucose 4-epimerase GalE [Bacteroidales bacterium]
MSQKILVTGGAGYIGSHTSVVLQNSGYDVHIIDNLANASPDVVNNIAKITGIEPTFTNLDLCDADALHAYFLKHQHFAGVIHFAAHKSVSESARKPLHYYHNNLLGLINILEEMGRTDCRNLVFSSSCTVYGQPDHLPVAEDAPLKKAASPYGNTKKICEDIITDQAANKQVRAISLRYFNPTGAHDSACIGEMPMDTPNNLVPYLTQTSIGKREQLRVFGSDYNTPDGSGIRDYIHVMDLANAHLSALERLSEKRNEKNPEVFNLGTGQGYSVLDVIWTFERVTGVKVNYTIAQRRPGDIEKVWADPSRANKALNWHTRYSLEEMLESAWIWELTMKAKQETPQQ